MHRTRAAVFVAAALMSGGMMAVTSVELAAGTASADPACSPANANTPPCAPPEGPPACNAFGDCGQLWCPGSGMRAPDWDMSVCHTFHWDPDAPLNKPILIPGNPPGPPAPPPPPCIPLVNCLPGLTHP